MLSGSTAIPASGSCETTLPTLGESGSTSQSVGGATNSPSLSKRIAAASAVCPITDGTVTEDGPIETCTVTTSLRL